MCGFVGIYTLGGRRTIDSAVLEAMNETQHHRGPDGSGLFTDAGVGLGHRRLSIIDLAGGRQPLFNADGSVVVVYNGEIYNFRDLMAELTERGYQFTTRCDTEVIVNAWREWGADCVERFRGMFAFALYDRREDMLFLARDRLGIKPLYYGEFAGHFLLASELKGVMAHPAAEKRLDPQAVDDYFAFGYVPEPRAIFSGVKKLPAGHTLTVSREGAGRPRRYWDLDFSRRPASSPAALTDSLIDHLDEAVRLRMIADVPLGAFLSGGVDSSAVVAMMAGASDRPVNTCSIRFDEGAYDESAYAEQMARRYGTAHRVGTGKMDDLDLIDSLAGMFDEPFADSSAMPTFRVSELARQGVTVALSGDGGDEVFAGYSRYRWHMLEERIRSAVGAGGSRALGGMVRPLAGVFGGPLAAAADTLAAAGRNPMESYFDNIGILDGAARRRLYSDSMRADLQGYQAADLLRRTYEAAPAEDTLSRLQYVDFKTYLPGDILTKVDRTSMAVSLEVRVPILDHRLVEWAGGIDPALKLHGRDGKHIFKKALEPHVPADVLYRPKKGFAVPLAAWFRGPLKDRLRADLTRGALADCGLFDTKEVTRLIDRHQSGAEDESGALWALLMFDSFIRRWYGEGGFNETGARPMPASAAVG